MTMEKKLTKEETLAFLDKIIKNIKENHSDFKKEMADLDSRLLEKKDIE
jgi:hypothetical protein